MPKFLYWKDCCAQSPLLRRFASQTAFWLATWAVAGCTTFSITAQSPRAKTSGRMFWPASEASVGVGPGHSCTRRWVSVVMPPVLGSGLILNYLSLQSFHEEAGFGIGCDVKRCTNGFCINPVLHTTIPAPISPLGSSLILSSRLPSSAGSGLNSST